ncbi:MAG: glutamate 5-kinase [Dehalococcoidia bacterium]|nr:glutamate 5-kinase [Dehalococcoidia bacterium]
MDNEIHHAACGTFAVTTDSAQSSPSAPEGQPPLRYRRIVAKAGTGLLTGGSDRLDLEVMASLVGQIARLYRQGAEVLLVTSGAVAAGRQIIASTGIAKQKDAPSRQVLAAIGQGRLMNAYEQLFAWSGIPVAQALLTRRDIADRLGYLNIRNSLLALLALGVAPIINENDVVAVDELEGESFGDNDTLSAMVANIVDADALVLLSDVAGLYTADPHTHPGATLIPHVDRIDASVENLASGALSERSRGGMRTKVEAARLATASGTCAFVCDGREPNALERLARGESLGTMFSVTASKLESRERWMLGVCAPNAGIVVDAGAERALRQQNRSLLPPGVRGVRGEFRRGEVVPIVNEAGERLAAGIANYGSDEVRRLAGKRSDRVQAELGYTYGEEVVHRNNMVVV